MGARCACDPPAARHCLHHKGREVGALYRQKAGPNSGIKARAREVRELLTSAGSEQALETVDVRVDVLGIRQLRDEGGYLERKRVA